MKKYIIAMSSWLILLFIIMFSEFLIFRLTFPFLSRILMSKISGFSVGLVFITKLFILFTLVLINVISIYLLITKTKIGLELKHWFIDVNKNAFGTKR